MDPFSPFALRSEGDELALRAMRAGFKRAGLSHTQLAQAMEWYADHGRRLGGDVARIAEGFAQFAASKHWQPGHIDAAIAVRDQIAEAGLEAFLGAPPTAAEDAATIARATAMLRDDAAAYWRDHDDLREEWAGAIERTQAATAQAEASPPPVAHAPTDRDIAQRDMERFVTMLRDPIQARSYWQSPDLQRQYHDAIARSTYGPAAAVEPAAVDPTPAPTYTEGTTP